MYTWFLHGIHLLWIFRGLFIVSNIYNTIVKASVSLFGTVIVKTPLCILSTKMIPEGWPGCSHCVFWDVLAQKPQSPCSNTDTLIFPKTTWSLTKEMQAMPRLGSSLAFLQDLWARSTRGQRSQTKHQCPTQPFPIAHHSLSCSSFSGCAGSPGIGLHVSGTAQSFPPLGRIFF